MKATRNPPAGAATAALRGRRVLVVEDNGLLCGMLDETLRDAGCQVVGPYTTLEQAMAAMPAIQMIDIALVDISVRGELARAGELTQSGYMEIGRASCRERV